MNRNLRSLRTAVCSFVLGEGTSILLILLSVVFLASSQSASANDATPIPSGCTVAPRSFASISALLATPAADQAAESGIPMMGEPLQPEEWTAVASAVKQFVDCANAGEPLRVYALYSDAYLLSLLSRERPLLDQDRYDALATPIPATPEQQATITDIEGGRRFADGTFGVNVTISYPNIPEPKTFFFRFISTPKGLLINDIMGELTFSLP
jgi:hypothetical protein